MTGGQGIFNLKTQLVFYGTYHSHPINQIIHFIFVPLILWTVAVWLAYTPSIASIPEDTSWNSFVVFNGSFALILVYSAYYVMLDTVVGLTWSLCVGIPIWLTAEAFTSMVDAAWAWALALHVFSWWVQVHIGHILIEKRRPALLDSFFQSLALAPLFVWFEFLFYLGFRKALFAKISADIEESVARLRKPLVGEDSADQHDIQD